VATGRDRGWAWIAVHDDGPGIDPDDQALVFDRFWRGRPGGTEVGAEGGEHRTGLGLAIVRQVLESHGGTVAVHSTPGAGATFVLWLPLAPERSIPREPRPPLHDPVFATPR
jgi:signal transduction histidine kinase